MIHDVRKETQCLSVSSCVFVAHYFLTCPYFVVECYSEQSLLTFAASWRLIIEFITQWTAMQSKTSQLTVDYATGFPLGPTADY